MPTTSTWSIDGKTFTAVSKTFNDNAYAFASMDFASINIYFKTIPTTSKTYTVTDAVDGEVKILTNTVSPMMVGAEKSGTVKVTVADGKIRMELDVTIEKEDGSGGKLGDGKLTGDLVY